MENTKGMNSFDRASSTQADSPKDDWRNQRKSK